MANRNELIPLIARFNPTDTDADVLAALTAKTEQRIDPRHYSFMDLIGILGEEMTEAILTALGTAAATNAVLAATLTMLQGSGLRLSDPMVQAKLTSLQESGVLTSEQATALKGIGIQYFSILEMSNIPDVTEADIHDTRAASWVLSVKLKICHAYNSFIERMDSGEQITLQQFKEFVAAL